MSDIKAIPCKSMPIREFILDESKPNQIGVRLIDGISGGRYWFNQKHVDREIEKHERQLEFWRELRELFENRDRKGNGNDKWESLSRGFIEHEPDQTYGAADG